MTKKRTPRRQDASFPAQSWNSPPALLYNALPTTLIAARLQAAGLSHRGKVLSSDEAVQAETGQLRLNISQLTRVSEELQLPLRDLLAPEDRDLDAWDTTPTDLQPLLLATLTLSRLLASTRALEALTGEESCWKPGVSYEAETGVSGASHGEAVARQERARLGLGDRPISDLRALMEDESHLRVYRYPMDLTVSVLYRPHPQAGGVIGLNSLQPEGNARVSLAKALGAALMFPSEHAVWGGQDSHPGENTRPGKGHPDPRHGATHHFAQAFLLPESGLRRDLARLRRQPHPDALDLLHLSRRWNVNPGVFLGRLMDLEVFSGRAATPQEQKGQAGEASSLQIDDVPVPRQERPLERYPEHHRRLVTRVALSGLLSREALCADHIGGTNLEDLEALIDTHRAFGVQDRTGTVQTVTFSGLFERVGLKR